MNGFPESTPKLALVSVSDKTGIVEFARALVSWGFAILSTGGTARMLSEAGISVTEVSEHTGFPEIMAGRVKTLHPRIHGGLLGRPGLDDAVMAEQDIPHIDLAVINLYPFEEVTGRAVCSLADAIENIDIGGPAMVRSAAKNFAAVGVVTSPAQYPQVLARLEAGNGQLDQAFRFELAVAAFNCIARYDGAIGNYLSGLDPAGQRDPYPRQINLCFQKVMDLRYGENPHQSAAWYRDLPADSGSLAEAQQLQGRELSFNNIADSDAAWACVQQFASPACVIVKHANPCGVGVDSGLRGAWHKAFATDPISAYGGIIAFNAQLDAPTASEILERQFVEVLIAPGFSSESLQVLQQKPNVRVLSMPPPSPGDGAVPPRDSRRVRGGMLMQTADDFNLAREQCRVVSRKQPSAAQWDDLLFAWKVARMVKSNAIVFGSGGQTLGIGAGQMSRIDSARIARWKAADAGFDLKGSAMASDAFFPFRDGIDTAAEAGIAGVIQPGGSMRDEEIIAAADEHGLAMVFTGVRHFRH